MANDGQMTQSTYLEIDGLPARVAPLEDAVAALPTTYQTLTAAAKQDAALAELIDGGAKNIFHTSATTGTVGEITFTNSNDGTWSTSGTATDRRQKALTFSVPIGLPAGDYVLSGCPAGGAEGATTKYCLYIWDITTNTRVSQNDVGSGVEFSWTPDTTHSYYIAVDIRKNTNANNLTFKPMICTKAAWGISRKFIPYAPTNAELYAMIQSMQ